MGISTSKSTSKVDNKTTESGTTTPVVNPFVSDSLLDYLSQINQFGQVDPSTLVAGPSALQNQAFGGAAGLNGNSGFNWQQGLQSGLEALGNVNPATLSTSQAATLGPVNTAGQVNLGNASQVGQTQLGQATGWQAPTQNGSGFMSAAGGTYDPTSAEGAAINVEGFMAPTTQALVDTTLADFDVNSERTRASQAANAAKNGAFRGSRYGIQEAATEGELARARAAADAQIRDRAFTQAAGLATSQAGLTQAANLANAGWANQAGMTGANNQTAASIANANMSGQFGLANMGYQAQAASDYANSQNQFALAQAGFDQQGNLANAAANNQFALTQGGMDLQNNQFNAGQGNQFALNQAQLGQQNNQFNAGAANNMSQYNAGLGLQQAGMYGQLAQAGGNLAQGDLQGQQNSIALQGNLGAQQQALQQQQQLAQLAQLQALSGLYGGFPTGAFTGQQFNSTGTMNGTSVGTQTQSPFSAFLQFSEAAAKAIAAGGGGK